MCAVIAFRGEVAHRDSHGFIIWCSSGLKRRRHAWSEHELNRVLSAIPFGVSRDHGIRQFGPQNEGSDVAVMSSCTYGMEKSRITDTR